MSAWMHRIIPIVVLVHGLPAIPAGAAPPPAPAPQTGQTACYGPKGLSVIDCDGSGQDGETRAGVAWPEPRYADAGRETVADRLTGLVWPRDADPPGGSRDWQQALDYVNALNARNGMGHDDWRLPNVNELASLASPQADAAAWLGLQGFGNVRKDDYWTSTTYAPLPGSAWSVGMTRGTVTARRKTDRLRVWPVRGGNSGAVALPRTGQVACHDHSGADVACAGTGQDGALQAGAAWPSPRFVDNGDGTLFDALTGLVWARQATAPGPPACGPGTRKDRAGALDHVRCLNARRYLGRGDWRLPNRNELASLVNRGQPDSAAWLNSQGFSGVRQGGYWSSTTFVGTAGSAWGVNMQDGAATSFSGKHDLGVWPVRGGIRGRDATP